MIADAAHVAHRGDRLGGVRQQRLLEFGIGPGLGDDDRAVARADLGLVGLDDGVERGRIDIALLGQHGFQRAHAKLHLRQLRAVLVVMIVVMVVIVCHGDLQASDLRYNIAMSETSRTTSASLAFADRIDRLNAAIGRSAAWLCLFVVLVQFAVVVLRYVFGLGSIWLTEIDHLRPCRAVHAGRGLDAAEGGHVRVDVFYADAVAAHAGAGRSRRRAAAAAAVHAGAALVRGCPMSARSWAIFERRARPAACRWCFAEDADPGVRAADGAAGRGAGDPARIAARSPSPSPLAGEANAVADRDAARRDCSRRS